MPRLGLVASLLAVNWVAQDWMPAQIDLTGNRAFTLSGQTQNLLASCQTSIEIVVLAPQSPRTAGDRLFQQVAPAFQELAADYHRKQPLIRVRQVDPDRDAEGEILLRRFPDLAPPCALVWSPSDSNRGHETLTVRDLADFLQGETGRATSIDFLGEQALTAALSRLIQGNQQGKVCITNGHGELNPQDVEPNSRHGLGMLATLLQQVNCQVETLDLIESPRVPPETSLVLIAGGEKEWTVDETAKLDDYLRQGGRLCLFAPAPYDRQANQLAPCGLEDLLSRFGLHLGNDYVVTQNFAGQPETASPAFPTAVDHPLVRSLPPSPVTLHESRSLQLAKQGRRRPGTVIPLLVSQSAPRAWAEGNFSARGIPNSGGPGDTDGPVAMALAVERPGEREPAPVLVVVGDARFASNRELSTPDGRISAGFALSCLNWLRGRRELMGDIPPRRREGYRLTGTPEEQRGLVWKPCLLFCAVIATTGFSVWASRRVG